MRSVSLGKADILSIGCQHDGRNSVSTVSTASLSRRVIVANTQQRGTLAKLTLFINFTTSVARWTKMETEALTSLSFSP